MRVEGAIKGIDLNSDLLFKTDKSYAKNIGQSSSDHFRVIWNSPTDRCHTKYGYDLNWDKYGIEVNKKDGWFGEKITIFYKSDIGTYPYFDDEGNPVNGGIPQAVNLKVHLTKASEDIRKYVPDFNFTGLAVIDWEPWRPLWERNWDKKKIYQLKSEDRVRQEHPLWNKSQIETKAKADFTKAARDMMEQTVLLGEKLRPLGKWGFYEFPECYNGKYGQKTCDSKARSQNDELSWLFETVSSEYPSAYLSSHWNETHKTGFVHGQIQEGLRVAAFGSGRIRPVFMYSRYQYSPLYPFYSHADLWVTIKQAADFGIAGAVLWGDHYSEFNQSVCEAMVDYVHSTLGPTVKKILNRTRSCEQLHCLSKGRCVLRKTLSAKEWIQFNLLSDLAHESIYQSVRSKTKLKAFYSTFYICI